MTQTVDSDDHTTVRVKLLHVDEGEIGGGKLKFGYDGLASVALENFGLDKEVSDEQLAAGLLAITEGRRKLTLFNCKRSGYAIYPEFVVEGEVHSAEFDSFDVRYSEVSEWFFQEMHVGGELGKELKWHTAHVPLVANVVTQSASFTIESCYVGSLEGSGEDRTLHQHFEFRFTAKKNRFSLDEIRKLALRFSNLLSILLARPCPIVSVDVSPNGDSYRRLYYGISRAPQSEIQGRGNGDLVTWRKFFALKSDVDDCWEQLVNAFFCSEYREVIWSRLAGMQKHDGFWEHGVLGYMTILDSYVTQRFPKASAPKVVPTAKLRQLEKQLARIRPPLDSTQQTAVIAAASQIFSSSPVTFASRFEALFKSLDPDVRKILRLTQVDFEVMKKLRDAVAHGDELPITGTDVTHIFEIKNRIILLLTHLFFLDVGLGRDIFLECLSRPHTEMRMISDLDEVHLDRTLYPEKFISVSSQELSVIQKRQLRLHQHCFERDLAGVVSYSEKRSLQLFDASNARKFGQIHELLDLPKVAVSYLAQAYFEDAVLTEPVHSAIIVDLAHVPV